MGGMVVEFLMDGQVCGGSFPEMGRCSRFFLQGLDIAEA